VATHVEATGLSWLPDAAHAAPRLAEGEGGAGAVAGSGVVSLLLGIVAFMLILVWAWQRYAFDPLIPWPRLR
jgi:hypothetical protein